MMYGREKSGSAIVAGKPTTNKAERSAAEPSQGECGPAKRVPDSEPGQRVTGAGTHTTSIRRLDPR